MTHHDALRLIDNLQFYGLMNLIMLGVIIFAIFSTDHD